MGNALSTPPHVPETWKRPLPPAATHIPVWRKRSREHLLEKEKCFSPKKCIPMFPLTSFDQKIKKLNDKGPPPPLFPFSLASISFRCSIWLYFQFCFISYILCMVVFQFITLDVCSKLVLIFWLKNLKLKWLMLQLSICMYYNINFAVFMAGSPLWKTPTSPLMFPKIWGKLLHRPLLMFPTSLHPGNLVEHWYHIFILVISYKT